MAEEVGQAYVSIVPSLRGFSKLLKKQLQKELAGGAIEVPIRPDFDEKAFRNLPDTGNAPAVPVELDPQTNLLKSKLAQITKTAGKTNSFAIPVEPQGKTLRQRLGALIAGESAGLHANVPVDPQGRGLFRRKLQLMLASIRGEKVHVEVETDFDKDRLQRGLSTAASEAVQSGGTVGRSFATGFSGVTAFLLPLAVLGAVVAIPAAGAAVAATVVAGASLGALFVGAFALRGDKDLRNAVTGLFGKIDKGLTAAAQPLKGPFLEALQIIGQAFKDIAPDVRDFFKTIAASGGIQDLARGISGLIKSLVDTGALQKLANSIGPILTQLGMALPDLGNAFSQLLISITKPDTIKALGQILRGTADVIRFVGSALGFLSTAFQSVQEAIGWVVLGFKTLFGAAYGNAKALSDLKSVAVGFVEDVLRLFRRLTGGAKDSVDSVVGFVKGIPGRIVSAVGNLGGLLVNAGRNVVQGLIDGIRNKFGDLGSVASQMAQTVRNFLPFSPAKEGPLSGSGNPFHSGQVIAGDVARGIHDQLPSVAGAASQLAGQFGVGGPGLNAGAAARPGFTINASGDRLSQLLLLVLRETIQNQYGGKVDLALGNGS